MSKLRVVFVVFACACVAGVAQGQAIEAIDFQATGAPLLVDGAVSFEEVGIGSAEHRETPIAKVLSGGHTLTVTPKIVAGTGTPEFEARDRNYMIAGQGATSSRNAGLYDNMRCDIVDAWGDVSKVPCMGIEISGLSPNTTYNLRIGAYNVWKHIHEIIRPVNGTAGPTVYFVHGLPSVAVPTPGVPMAQMDSSAINTYTTNASGVLSIDYEWDPDGYAAELLLDPALGADTAANIGYLELLPTGANLPPVVSAGDNQLAELPASVATLDGTVSDDGLPDPPASVTLSWTMVSGPAAVLFADPTAEDTTATFTAEGTYELRLTADDSEYQASDDVQILVSPPDLDLICDMNPLCPYERKLDGQWQGSMVASDGKTYFGSSTHAHNAAGLFFQYDPWTGAVTQIGPNMSAICGEDPLTQVPQGKLHSPIVESNGWLYTSTHLANYWDEAQNVYTGAHLIGYELGSLEAGSPNFRDFGIPRTRFSCYSGVAVSPAGDYLWSIATPFADADVASSGSHVYRTNIATGVMVDYGEINPGVHGGQACTYMHVDNRGDCWMTISGGQDKLFVARAASVGTIDAFPGALPTMSHQYIPGTPSAYQDASYWRWGHSVDGEIFLFTMTDSGAPYADRSGGSLYEFDASKTLDGDLSDAFREIAWIGGSGLGMAYGGQNVYFVRRDDGYFDAKITAVRGNGEYWDPAYDDGVRHHLYSVPADGSGPVTDWGKITDSEGRVPWRLEGVSANDTIGQVYMTGDWVMKETDPIDWRTLRHDGGTSTTYTLHIRGQAFLIADVPGPIEGDFDLDGDVDGADFLLWQAGYPTPSGASILDGDADGDGDVDGADFLKWQANYPTP